MVALDPGAVIADGRTAADLGLLPAFDEDEFASLSMPYTAKKPGKIAYALAYKATL